MCGITAVLQEEGEVFDQLLEGLLILQNRGYDSAGISTLLMGRLTTSKFASTESVTALGLLKDCRQLHVARIGIGHTRWATHGQKTKENSHPHMDSKSRLSLVHNGIIHNYLKLKQKLVAKGYTFKSQTDTEVIAQLIGSYLDQGRTFEAAIGRTQKKLKGTWACVCLWVAAPSTIFLMKNGNPLLLTVSKTRIQVSSEASVFKGQYYLLEDGQALAVSLDGVRDCLTGLNVEIDATCGTLVAQDLARTLTPAPYPHWTLKEIFEQPETVQSAISSGTSGSLKTVQHLLILGCGSSYFSGLYASKHFRRLGTFSTVRCLDAAEFSYDELPNFVNSTEIGAILISQSGETMDVYRSLGLLKKRGIFCLGIINVENSLIAREVDQVVYLKAKKETAVAATKSFTGQVSALLSLGFSKTSESAGSLKSLPDDVKACLKLQEQCKKVAVGLGKCQHLFILGRGLAEPIALEGALKIKEISYIHAEGYSAAALKHGSYAIIEPQTPCILIILNDEYRQLMLSTAEELKARNAHLICISPTAPPAELFNDTIEIPTNDHFSSLLAVVPLQLLAYELGVQRGNSIDLCRNLAKTVTVD